MTNEIEKPKTPELTPVQKKVVAQRKLLQDPQTTVAEKLSVGGSQQLWSSAARDILAYEPFFQMPSMSQAIDAETLAKVREQFAKASVLIKTIEARPPHTPTQQEETEFFGYANEIRSLLPDLEASQ